MEGKRDFADRLIGFDAPTVWQEFTPLSIEHKSCNLGQGFPDWPAPAFCKDAFIRAINEDHNQYTRSQGHMNLVKALSKRYSPLFGREIDPLHHISVGVGATETMFAIMQAFIKPGDEVICMEPAFDIYLAQIQMAGGAAVMVPLRLVSSQWKLDYEELRSKITPRTKALVLNTPHNPTGKMFTYDELKSIKKVLDDHPHIIVITDEVYEFITFGTEHVRFATLPGMWDRTITVSSSGKTFSITGWKVGWAIGPKKLIQPITLANQWVQYSVGTPNQQAIAYALEEADKPYEGYENYYAWLRATYKGKRDRLMQSLSIAGLSPIVPDGGIFVMADTAKLTVPESYMNETTEACPSMTRDWALCRYLTKEKGVTAIPPSAFYKAENKHLAANLARFAYCKTDEVLIAADERFKSFFS